MKKARFFALLHFRRHLTTKDKAITNLMLKTFQYGYTLAWDRQVGD